MKIIHSLEFQTGSKEENLPYDTPAFPYLASRAELDSYREPFVPWHWHNAIELFYMESGKLKYYTPHQNLVFPAGTAGMVNANVLHKTQIQTHTEDNIQLLHIFDPQLLAGTHGSLIERKYISPVITASQIELIALSPDDPAQAAVIALIRDAFSLSEKELGYEFKIREALSRIWLELFQMCAPLLKEKSQAKNISSDKAKGMMVYIHEHYAEKISIRELASAVFLSERESSAHDSGRLYQKLPHPDRLPDAGGKPGAGHRGGNRLRYGKFQLLRKGIPGGDRLYAASIPPQMAG